MDFKRVKNDVNGNPRYVFHFLEFLTEDEMEAIKIKARPFEAIGDMYSEALNKARFIGGKKYKGNDFGGGIVFQSHNIQSTINLINKLIT